MPAIEKSFLPPVINHDESENHSAEVGEVSHAVALGTESESEFKQSISEYEPFRFDGYRYEHDVHRTVGEEHTECKENAEHGSARADRRCVDQRNEIVGGLEIDGIGERETAAVVHDCPAAVDDTYVQLEVDGKVVETLSLDEDTVRKIETDNGGRNVLVIKDGEAEMSEANCPDGICTNHRKIHRNGESIICLPHKVVVTVVNENDADEVDAVA